VRLAAVASGARLAAAAGQQLADGAPSTRKTFQRPCLSQGCPFSWISVSSWAPDKSTGNADLVVKVDSMACWLAFLAQAANG